MYDESMIFEKEQLHYNVHKVLSKYIQYTIKNQINSINTDPELYKYILTLMQTDEMILKGTYEKQNIENIIHIADAFLIKREVFG